MKLVTLDFETYYDSQYSLSKMTTAEYIHHPQFQIIGVSVAVDDEDPRWFSLGREAKYASLLNTYCEGQTVLAHNARFDGGILTKLGIQPGFWLDTLSMARPLHGLTVGGSLKALAEEYGIGQKGTEVVAAMGKRLEEFTREDLAAYGQYCINDVVLTRELFRRLYRRTSQQELRIIDQTIKLATRPLLRLDSAILEDSLLEIREAKSAALERSGVDKADLMSNPKFAKLLIERGVTPGMKVSPKTGKESYAFAKKDAFMQELLAHEDPEIAALAAARTKTKSTLAETRTETMIRLAKLGPFSVPLSYCGAVTSWRFSGTDGMNLQNLPRGSILRRAIRAPKGHKLVVADLSNIEMRVLHALAEQTESVEALRAGEDLYCVFATALYGRPITKADKAERWMGKTAQLGLGFGMGHARFRETCREQGVTVDEVEAKRVVDLWRATYPAVTRLWKEAGRAIEAMLRGEAFAFGHREMLRTSKNLLLTPPQHYIQYPKLHRTEDGFAYRSRRGRGTEIVRMYGPKLVENFVQHIARNVFVEQWLKIAKRYPIALQVHDELVAVVPDAEAEDALPWMLEIMSTAPSWWPTLPLAAEGGIADNYGDAK